MTACPFCAGTDFDLPGLKSHLLAGDCSAFESTENLRRVFGPEPRLEVTPTRSITLPYPVSANQMWRTVYAKKLGRCITYLSTEAEKWKKDARWIAVAAGFREPVVGPIALRVRHHHRGLIRREIKGVDEVVRNGNVFDLDNILKVAIDSMKGSIFVDDKQVKKIVAEYGEPTADGKIVIGVEELPEVQASLFPKPEPVVASRGGAPF